MSTKGIRPVPSLSLGVADTHVSRAVRQLEERVNDLARVSNGGTPEAQIRSSYVVKTADTTYSFSTDKVPVNASGLPMMGFSVKAYGRYRFRFVSVVRSTASGAGTGLVMTIFTPSAAVLSYTGRFPGIAVQGSNAEWVESAHVSGLLIAPTPIFAANRDFLFTIEGIIVPSADGAITLLAGDAGFSGDVTVRQGSFGELHEQSV